MDWILDHIQVVFILVAVAVAGAGKLLEAIRQAAARRGGGTFAETMEAEFSTRQVRERAQAATPPPLRQVKVQAVSADAERMRQQEMQERLRRIREAKSQASAPAAAETVEILAVVKPRPLSSGALKGRLHDRREIRKAFIMREVLGPPTGCR